MDIFKAEERTIRNILEKKEIKYVIPRNQRNYVWEKKQWKELFIDINESIEFENNKFIHKDYFIGSCVLSNTEKKNLKSIVDGQQRITTITIILSVLYDIFKELNQEKLLTGIYSYIHKEDDNGDEYFIIENEEIEPFYSEMILFKTEIKEEKESIDPKNKQEIRILDCYNFFYKYLKEKCSTFEKFEIEYLKAFRTQLLDLKIIEISVNNKIDAYTIFEILNAKGKQLELGDRMKNWILKRLPKKFPSDTAKSKWDKIKSNIESISKSENNFSNFIKHYWISRYEKLKDEDEIYHYFKTEIKKEDMMPFLTDLEKSSNHYAKIASSNKKQIITKLDFVLSSLINFRTSQIRPIALSLFHVHEKGLIQEKDLIKYLKVLEHFHFIYTAICSTPANKIEKIYHVYAPKIRNNFSKELMTKFVEELDKKKPNFTTFRRSFVIKGYSNKNNELKGNRSIINYILQKIEYYKQGTNEFKIDDLTIEHIANDDGSETNAKIGNLLPLAKRINGNCGNDNYKLKINKYKNSQFITVKDFLKYHSEKEEWNEKDITERTNMIAKLSYDNIWKIKI